MNILAAVATMIIGHAGQFFSVFFNRTRKICIYNCIIMRVINNLICVEDFIVRGFQFFSFNA